MMDKPESTVLTEHQKYCAYILYLIQDILVPALPRERQELRLGSLGPGVAWELKNDILNGSNAILGYGLDYSQSAEISAVSEIKTAIEILPNRITVKTGMLDSAWLDFNAVAGESTKILEKCGITACAEYGLDYYDVINFKDL